MPFAGNSPAERRITLRLLSYWEKTRRGRPMPERRDISPEDVPELWDECFMLQVEGAGYKVEHISNSLAAVMAQQLGVSDPVLLQDERKNSWLADMGADPRPLLFDGEFVNNKGRLVRFRQCLLPLGSGGRVTAVLGALRYKEV